MHGSKNVREGLQLILGEGDQIHVPLKAAIIGLSAIRHLNVVSLAGQ